MKDIKCPYCEKWQDVDNDDGSNYELDTTHEMQCEYCEKNFVFHTTVIYSYEAEKADCLNGGEHDYQLTNTHPKYLSKMRCKMCDIERYPTEYEKIQFELGTKEDYWNSLK